MIQPMSCCDEDVQYSGISFACHVSRLPYGEMTIWVRGEVDSVTAPVLDAFLSEQLAVVPPFSGVEVVVTRMTFIGARGIVVLLDAAQNARRRKVDFRVIGCSEWLLRVFAIAGVGDQLAASG